MATAFTLRDATPADMPVVVHFVRALAEYEKLLHEAKGTEADFAAAFLAKRRAPPPSLRKRMAKRLGFASGIAPFLPSLRAMAFGWKMFLWSPPIVAAA